MASILALSFFFSNLAICVHPRVDGALLVANRVTSQRGLHQDGQRPLKTATFATQLAGTFRAPDHVEIEEATAPINSSVCNMMPKAVLAQICLSLLVTGLLFMRAILP